MIVMHKRTGTRAPRISIIEGNCARNKYGCWEYYAAKYFE